jgi:hypothetical protein
MTTFEDERERSVVTSLADYRVASGKAVTIND